MSFPNMKKLGPKMNFLSEKPRSNPLTYQPSPPPQLPSSAPLAKPPVASPPIAAPPVAMPPVSSPPMTNVNSVSQVNKIPNNLSRMTKIQKIDHFPRLYHLLKT